MTQDTRGEQKIPPLRPELMPERAILRPEGPEAQSSPSEFRVRRSREQREQTPILFSEIDPAHTHRLPDGGAVVAHKDGSQIAIARNGSVEIRNGENLVRQSMTPAEHQFVEKHHGAIDMRNVAELHHRFQNRPEMIDAFFKHVNRP